MYLFYIIQYILKLEIACIYPHYLKFWDMKKYLELNSVHQNIWNVFIFVHFEVNLQDFCLCCSDQLCNRQNFFRCSLFSSLFPIFLSKISPRKIENLNLMDMGTFGF